MKKITIIAVLLISITLIAGCDSNGTTSEPHESDGSTTWENIPISVIPAIEKNISNSNYDYYYDYEYAYEDGCHCYGDVDIGKFRPLFYNMPAPFAELVGREVFRNWILSRSDEERENENVAISFIRYFDISREDFTRANEEIRQIWEDHGASSIDGASFEIYPVDLIFTFDNERINRYFLWENSPAINSFGWGMERGNARPLFYNTPASFARLVGREVFIEWKHSRSPEERANESIAVSFIRYFNISREDFERANEEVRQVWASRFTAADGALFEAYNVDLIFSFDNERINRYFLWENSAAIIEFGWGMERGNARPLFYNMPAPFARLVGREVFIEWKHSRSQEERANESIAVSFIKYFDISREDFERANEEVRQAWGIRGLTAEHEARFEVYDVDLIFSFDNEVINEFFLWRNSINPNEREFGN